MMTMIKTIRSLITIFHLKWNYFCCISIWSWYCLSNQWETICSSFSIWSKKQTPIHEKKKAWSILIVMTSSHSLQAWKYCMNRRHLLVNDLKVLCSSMDWRTFASSKDVSYGAKIPLLNSLYRLLFLGLMCVLWLSKDDPDVVDSMTPLLCSPLGFSLDSLSLSLSLVGSSSQRETQTLSLLNP